MTVLVAGATGHLGARVVRALLRRGRSVRALVRPGSRAEPLEALGVEVVRGDLLEPRSLAAACEGVRSVVTTAIGYSSRRRGDFAGGADDVGQRNLVDAARATRVERFVFTSVLTCDRAPDVPHFAAKHRVEQYLDGSGIPCVALRPGAFVDQSTDFWIGGLRRGRLPVLGDPDVRWSYVHTQDLASRLAAATDLPADAPRVIDVGCDRPVSMREVASLISSRLGRPIALQVLPWPIASALFAVQGLANPWMSDFRKMFGYILRGGYVADLDAQRRWLGEPEPIERAVERYLEGTGLVASEAAVGTTGGHDGRRA